MRKILNLFLGIVISCIMLYFVFRKINFGEVIHYISSARLLYLLLSIVLCIMLLVLRSYRWKTMLKEYKSVKLQKFFESTILGLFFNTVLPFRMGDLFQGYVLSKKTSLSKSLTFSTVLLERFIDLFPPIIFIIIGSFFIVLPKRISLGLSIIVLTILVLITVLILKYKKFIISKLVVYSEKNSFIKKIVNVLEKFFSAVESISNIYVLCKIIPLTLLLWIGYSISMVLICVSLDINLPSLWAGFLIQAITALSVTVPSSPGYVGSWEFMGTLSLLIFKVNKTKAVSFAVLSHIIGMLPVIILGIIFLIKEISMIKSFEIEKVDNTTETL
jgi:uncharacterized protein (TIRG00374 family)